MCPKAVPEPCVACSSRLWLFCWWNRRFAGVKLHLRKCVRPTVFVVCFDVTSHSSQEKESHKIFVVVVVVFVASNIRVFF